MMLFLLSIAALWSGPLVQRTLSGSSLARFIVNLVMPVGMCVLVLFDVLPSAYQFLGPWSLVLAGWGLGLPLFFEWLWRRDGKNDGAKARWTTIILGLLGLSLHAAIDGASFASGGHDILLLIVLAHRFVEGCFIWVTVRSVGGVKAAVACLFLDSLGTAAGYAGGDILLSSIDGLTVAAGLQAVVAGSLLHLVFHRHLPSGGHGKGHTHGCNKGHDHPVV